MTLMKVAERYKIRPSVLILGKDSRQQRWSRTDIALAKAYERFTDELCKQCGLPKYICHNDDNRIRFKVAKDECQSSAVAQRRQKEMSEEKDATHFGVAAYGEPELSQEAIDEGLEFSDFRRPYLFDQAKRRGLIPEDAVL